MDDSIALIICTIKLLPLFSYPIKTIDRSNTRNTLGINGLLASRDSFSDVFYWRFQRLLMILSSCKVPSGQ